MILTIFFGVLSIVIAYQYWGICKKLFLLYQLSCEINDYYIFTIVWLELSCTVERINHVVSVVT